MSKAVHSSLGPSGAHRWMNCSGSNQLVDRLVEEYGEGIRRSGSAAALGTCAHTVMAWCLEKGTDAKEYLGQEMEQDGWKFVVDDEMVETVQQFVDFVYDKFSEFTKKGTELHVEVRLQSDLDEEAYGTADVLIYAPGDRIIIVDFKNGIGVVVEPDDEQLKEYGAIAYEKRPDFMRGKGEPKAIELWIGQPRIPHPEGIFRVHVVTPIELMGWMEWEVVPAMQKTREKDAMLKIGDWCKFCNARNHCPAIRKEVETFPIDVLPTALTSEEVGSLLVKMNAILKFKPGLEEEAFQRALAGDAVPGTKLVNKRANRAWKEGAEKAAKRKYGKVIYTEPKLKSPAQIDKLDKGKVFSRKWAFSPDMGLTLAPLSDKRKEAERPIDKIDLSTLEL